MGVLDRPILRDEQWERISPHIIGDERTRGSSGRDNRIFVEAVLWIVRTGSPWRDLPGVLGEWISVFRRFSRWSKKGVWWRMFAVMSDDPDFEYPIVDSTIVRAISTPPAQKRGRRSGPWPLSRRPEHQNPYGCTWSRLPGPLHTYRRPEGRCAASRRP